METVTLINGNGQEYTQEMPKIVVLTKHINDVALAHIKENTGLSFVKTYWGYKAQPTKSAQIAALLLTYNYKTKYHNNLDHKNTLFLKSDHHIGFKVDSICYDCCKENHLHLGGLEPGARLAC